MPNKRIVITNTIICSVLLILGFLVQTININHTYVTVTAPISNGKRDNNQIGLMFIVDDPQLANNLPSILETLNRAQAHATFFFTGNAATNNLEILKQIADTQELGNYGFSNTALNIADKNLITEEIKLGDTLIRSLTNIKMKVFTPPALQINKHVLAMAHSLGYTTILPTSREVVIDWENASSNIVLSYATYKIQAGDIIALKPTTATAKCFSQVAAAYSTNGFKITSLERLLQL